MRRRLALLGLRLPEVKPPAFHYVPVVVHGGVAYVSGQVPWHGGALGPLGKVAREVALEQAQEAARRCVLQALAWLNQTFAGGLDEVERALRVTGYVASSPGFDQQPTVIDAASEILVKVFGHAGHHARSAIGVAELPRNAPVEIEFIFAIKRRPTSPSAIAARAFRWSRCVPDFPPARLTARSGGAAAARDRRRPITGGKVLLVSFPKSGSNWVRYCVEHFSGRRTPGTTRRTVLVSEGPTVFDRIHFVDKRHRNIFMHSRARRGLTDYAHTDKTGLHGWLSTWRKDRRVRAVQNRRLLLLLRSPYESFARNRLTAPEDLIGYLGNVQAFEACRRDKLLVYYHDLVADLAAIGRILDFLAVATTSRASSSSTTGSARSSSTAAVRTSPRARTRCSTSPTIRATCRPRPSRRSSPIASPTSAPTSTTNTWPASTGWAKRNAAPAGGLDGRDNQERAR